MNINELIQARDRAKQDREQSIARAISENDSKVVGAKYAEFEALYNDVINNATSLKEQYILKANDEYIKTINSAKAITQDKKIKFKAEQDNKIKVEIGKICDEYINDLEQLIKKYGG